MGVVFSIAGLGVLAALAGRPLLRWSAAQDWLETPCTILRSEVRTHDDSDGDTYSVHIVYSYVAKDRKYESERYHFMGGSSSGYRSKQAIVDRYPQGSSAVCYVNPDDPSEAVLSRDFSFAYLIGLFGLPFFLAGTGMIIGSLRMRRNAAGIPPGMTTIAGRYAAPDGTIELRPRRGGFFQLFFVMTFACGWNGIVWAILLLTPREDISIVAFLVLIPFVLVGLALAAGVVYCVLALFNPRLKLRLSPGAIPLGATAELEWTVLGSTGRIQRFRIWLEGQETATYTRGTDSCTDFNVFEYIPIAEATDARDMRTGRVQFAIPEYTMHTFTASNNKICWLLKVHGDVPRWPDIRQEYELTVLPLPLAGEKV